jgi:hypothetical protein
MRSKWFSVTMTCAVSRIFKTGSVQHITQQRTTHLLYSMESTTAVWKVNDEMASRDPSDVVGPLASAHDIEVHDAALGKNSAPLICQREFAYLSVEEPVGLEQCLVRFQKRTASMRQPPHWRCVARGASIPSAEGRLIQRSVHRR